jgi:hypothetical protein
MTSFQMDVANLCFSSAAVVVMVSGAMAFSIMTLSNTKLNTSNKMRYMDFTFHNECYAERSNLAIMAFDVVLSRYTYCQCTECQCADCRCT